MVKRMLIDAARPGETRVAVVNGNHLDDFDFETEDKRQLKGNVYLAKVTRVEPSLQAAFVEYGGNRHGFLAFSEIHPDYYRIPIADREALLAEVSGDSSDTDADDTDDSETADETDAPAEETANAQADDDPASEDDGEPEQPNSDEGEEPTSDPIPLIATDSQGDAAENAVIDFTDLDAGSDSDGESGSDDESDDEPSEGRSVETVGGEETGERSRRRLQSLRNRYRIQEVIKRRQILLVQVTKEERGNKGAALTTYLSLAGRYCVLMPNTPRGGGISRKIANPKDRRRMKQILESLGVPDGMAIILRTAGLERTKQEIRRDADYLLRLWDQIRENTLKSSAPTLIHEEGNLIKRAIRDLHSRETEEILVSGEDGYRAAKDFMRMLVPSHARRVKQYRNPTVPLFHRYRVESQIEALHDPIVNLKSGGYIVINPTEALVSIDVNSGKSTRERNIEETAYRTNLEAAQEIGRQLRLRDLAGLIVIDFIDMDEHRHNSAVERRIKEAMRLDRARVQIGRISHFGLLELSRQRLRPSLQELDYDVCQACGGIGQVRTLGSSARNILRAIEEEGIRQRHSELLLTAPTDVIVTLLNDQREALRDIEERYQIRVVVGRDDGLSIGEQKIEGTVPKAAADRLEVEGLAEEIEEDEADQEDTESASKKRRRRRSRRSRKSEEGVIEAEQEASAEEEAEGEAAEAEASTDAESGEESPRRRRRGRRGGRRRSSKSDSAEATSATEDDTEEAKEAVAEAATEQPEAEKKPRTPRRPRRRKSATNGSTAETAAPDSEPADSDTAAATEVTTIPITVPNSEPTESQADPSTDEQGEPLVAADHLGTDIPANSARQAEAVSAEDADRPAKRGWWRRVLDG